MKETRIRKEVPNTLYSAADMREALANADPRTNTYMPVSAGIESTAALLYAIRDPNLHPFCVHWYEQRYGLFADAMSFYTQKQAEDRKSVV